MRTSGIVAILAAGVLALTGCGGEEPEAESSGAGSSAPAERPTTGAVSGESLDFTAKTIDGERFKGESLAGQPVVLWFWAAWCPTCKAKAPEVAALAKKHDEAVRVVGVGGLGEAPDMKRFVRENNLTSFPHLADPAGAVWKKFGVKTQDTYVLIDADGKVVHTGGLTANQLKTKVAELAK